jgi:hypothetical protein
VPGDSDTGMFGGNSNWRGPVWMPVNFLIWTALLRLAAYYGTASRSSAPPAREADEPLRGGSRAGRAAHQHLHPRRLGTAPSSEERRSSRPIRTGATASCSTSTSTGTTGQAWGRATRLAGPVPSPA